MPTHGLLNIVAAPQLGEASTYRAMTYAPRATKTTTATTSSTTTTSDDGASSKRGSVTSSSGSEGDGRSKSTAGQKAGATSVTDSLVLGGIDDPRVRAATAKLEALGYTPRSGGTWSSGQPYLDLGVKDGPRGWEAGISLPLMQLNIDKLRVRGGAGQGRHSTPHPIPLQQCREHTASQYCRKPCHAGTSLHHRAALRSSQFN